MGWRPAYAGGGTEVGARARKWTGAYVTALVGILAAGLYAVTGGAVGQLGLTRAVGNEAGTPVGDAQTPLLDMSQLPLVFAPNVGQAARGVRYHAQVQGASFAFRRDGAIFAFAKGEKGFALRLTFPGAGRSAHLSAERPTAGRVNYLVGDRAEWRTGIPTYGEVVYRDLWPGVDLAFRGAPGKLKYEFRLAPGAQVSDIALAYRGPERLSLGRSGDLRIHTPHGVLRDTAPVTYQVVGGKRVPVNSRYVVDGTRYGFAVGAYDASRPLVIDPGIVYSTYLGGSSEDIGHSIAVDTGGNAHVTGQTSSTNFPTSAGAFDASHNGGADVFVTKLDPTGNTLLYSTYLGGGGSDIGYGIAVDPAGNAHVTGTTQSDTFPTTVGAFDRTRSGADAFVTKLSAAGTPVYSTFLGGSGDEIGWGIDVDPAGNASVTGQTSSSNFPTTVGAYDTGANGGIDAFVTKVATTGNALVYSTYLGGSAEDIGRAIAVDTAGNAHVAGQTASGNFPTTPGAFDTTHNGGIDAFAAKLATTGNALVYSTFLGGSAQDIGYGIAVDAAGNAHVTGETFSSSYPTTPTAYDPTYNASGDAFVTKLTPTGNALIYSTFLGGSGYDVGFDVELDAGGNAHVTGETRSANFPTTPGAHDTGQSGSSDAFVTKLNTAGTAPLLYSTYLGGSNEDYGRGIDVDASSATYVTGHTRSSDFPTGPLGFDRTYNGGGDAFVTKLLTAAVPARMTLSPETDTNPAGTQHCVTARVTDETGSPVSGVRVVFTVTGANPTTGTVTTNQSGEAVFCYTGTAAGTDTITAFADTDGDGTRDANEPTAAATKVWTPATPSTMTLTPVADENPTGERHCFTATVRDAFGNPVPGVPVYFSVTGANTTSGAVTTNVDGQATFCYTGTRSGVDTVRAYADANKNGTQDTGEPSAIATKTYQPGDPAAVVVEPAADENPVGTEHCVTATVTDMFGNPVAGEQVVFEVIGANAQTPPTATRTTDTAGIARYCYTGTVAGADTIEAFVDDNGNGDHDVTGEPAGAATKTWVAGAPTTVLVSPPADTNVVGDQHCVSARVTDVFGNPVSGETVYFLVSGANTANGADTTDDSGNAEFCYTGTRAGEDLITAVADENDSGGPDLDEPMGSATKVWTAGEPAAVVLSPAADENQTGEQHCVTATVTDEFGNPVPDADVVFSVRGANPQTRTTTSTDDDGQATYCYTGENAGADTIEAFADSNENGERGAEEPVGTATKLYQAGDPATLLLEPAADENPVGEQHCVTATARDAFGNPVEDAQIVFRVDGANERPETTQTTDENGQAEFCYTGTRTGLDTITAYADSDESGSPDPGEPEGEATKVWGPGDPATVEVTPATATNTAGDEHCVTATVRDEFGNTVGAGVAVEFTVAGANSVGETIVETDENGEAEFCYTGETAGTDTIRAIADANDDGRGDEGEPMGVATKVYGPAEAAVVVLDPPADTNTAGEEHCVTATVTDAFGNRVGAGVNVRFTVTGANTATGVDATDENGQAEFCYTGTRAGVDAIRATADSDGDGEYEPTEATGIAEKTYGPARAATVEVSPATDVNRVNEQHCVTATVRDAFGNVVPDVRVEFDVSGANDRPPAYRTTDQAGVAEFCYTGTTAGTDTIRATVDEDGDGGEVGEPTGAATKLYRPGDAAAVVLSPRAATNEVADQHCVTADVRDAFGNPVEAGVQVEFDVNGVNDQPPAIRATNNDGQATYCYTGRIVGVDTIRATADGDGDGEPEAGEPSDVVEKTWRPGEAATVELNPRADENPVGEQHCVTATVRDEFGNPVEAGVHVEFDVNGANDRPPVIRTTDASGQATFCYTGTVAGPDTIRATADADGDNQPEAGEPTDVATKVYGPGEPATVTVSPPTAVNRAGEEHCVVATVRDEFGNPVPNARVEFDVTGSNDQPPAYRNTADDGTATFCYRGTVAGADAIRVTADRDGDNQPEPGEPTTAAEKTWRPGRPATVQLSPRVDTNEVGEQHCVTATVRDEFGNPVEQGVRVEFDVNGVNDRPPTIRTTDEGGTATFCYTGTVTGVDTIRATADGDEDGTVEPGEPTDVVEKTYLPGNAATVEVTPATDVNRVGEQHCVTATVRDAFGNPVDAGVEVEFDVTGANDRPPAIRTTDRNGQATFCYTGTVAGEDVIRATADADGDNQPEPGEPTNTATKTYRPGAPVAVTVTPETDENRVGEQHCVTATVRDEFGNPVDESVNVIFTVTGANPQPPTTVATGIDGRAEFCYTGRNVGEDVITATADTDGDGGADPTEPTGTATKTYRPGAPFSVVVSPAVATNIVGSQHCVTATVRDEFGNPVEAGVAVQFTVTGANTAGPTVRTTDESGEATFCYTGERAGEDVIRAVADADGDNEFAPTEPTGEAAKTYRPGAAATVDVSPKTDTNTVGDQHCVTATVRDELANPTPGVAVQFTVTGANTAGPTVTITDESGQARFCYTGTVAGEDVIRAVADANGDNQFAPTEPTGTATKTYEAGPEKTLELEPETATNTVGTEHCVTATVRDEFGNPVFSVTVRFEVSGASDAEGSDTTDRNGEAEFCYTGPPLPGADLIEAFADSDRDGMQDAGEPADTATKVWVLPVSTPLCEVIVTNGGWIIAMTGDRATFGGNAKSDGEGNVSGEEQYTDHGPAQPLSVHSTAILALSCSEDRTEATIYGTAEVDGEGEHFFRIRVRDTGEPGGRGDMYGILLDTGYYSGEQPLQGGNVQIR